MPKPKEDDLAYAAGLVEAFGTFASGDDRCVMSGREALMEWFQVRWGGELRKHPKQKEGRTAWYLPSKQKLPFFKAIQPYFKFENTRSKIERAINGLEAG